MKKATVSDLLREWHISRGGTGKEEYLWGSMVHHFMSHAKSQGIEELLITRANYVEIVSVFAPVLPWNWDGKKIWGIKLTLLRD